MRTLTLLIALCLVPGLSACVDDVPPDPGPGTDTDVHESLPTEATITLSEQGSPSPNDILVAVGAVVTFDNTASAMEAVIDFSADLPSAPDDVTVPAGGSATVVPEGGGEWAYTNRSAGAGVPASGTVRSEYDD